MNNNTIIYETIETLIEFIPKSINEGTKISELFQIDKEADALNRIVNLFEAYSWIVNAVKALKNHVLLGDIDVLKVNEILEEMESSLQIQDFVALSDLLEYEMNEILILWNKEIMELAEGNIDEMGSSKL